MPAVYVNAVPIRELSTILAQVTNFVYCSFKFKKVLLNYTLQQLKDRVETLIEQQGAEAYCGAWIYTAEDCVIYDEYDEPTYPAHLDRELNERIFNEVGNIDYIYQVIQECVDEVTEEQYMLQQQELV